jgi:hypothetical protein
MKCGNVKKDERKQTLYKWFIPQYWYALSYPYTLLNHSTREYYFPVTKSLLRGSLDLPQRLTTEAVVKLYWSPWCCLHWGSSPPGGVPRPPHKASSPLPTKPEGRRLAGELPRLRGSGAPCTTWSPRESPHKAGTPCISLSTKPMLIPHTLSMWKAFGYPLKQ